MIKLLPVNSAHAIHLVGGESARETAAQQAPSLVTEVAMVRISWFVRQTITFHDPGRSAGKQGANDRMRVGVVFADNLAQRTM